MAGPQAPESFSSRKNPQKGVAALNLVNVLLVIAVLTLAFPSASANAADESIDFVEPRNSENYQARIIRYFGMIAFGQEGTSDVYPLRKWVSPVRVELRGLSNPAMRKAVQSTLAKLHRATSFEIQLTEIHAEANLSIYVLPIHELRQAFKHEAFHELRSQMDSFRCTGVSISNERYEIVRAFVLIPSDKGEEVQRVCADEELAQAMGLPNDSFEAVGSMFNDDGKTTELSQIDLDLLALLYHPRLKPGMSRDAAIRIAKQVLPDILARKKSSN